MRDVKEIEVKLVYLQSLRTLVESDKLSASAREAYATKLKKLSDSIDKDLDI